MSGAVLLLPRFFVLLQVVFPGDMMLALLPSQLHILLGGIHPI